MILEKYTFGFLAESLGLKYLGDPALRALRFSTDTRSIKQGDLFVALSGQNFDGNDFIEHAIKKGAVAVIASKHIEGVTTFLCEDPLKCLQNIAALIFQHLQGLTIAITGTNGKTTVKEFVSCVHSAYGPTYATPGNFNNHIGLPLTIGGIPDENITSIFEMGANKPGDIKELITIAPTDLRVVCSIGEAHLEGFGDLEGVIRTKSEIFENATDQTYVCIPKELEDTLLFDSSKLKVISVGDESADIEMQYLDSYQTRYIDKSNPSKFDFILNSPFAGKHNALNMGLAIATLVAGEKYIPSGPKIQKALSKLVLPGGRSRVIEKGGHMIFDDAYNANPSSIKASLSTWLDVTPKKKGRERIVVIGEMFEMGEDAEQIHQQLASWIGELDIERVVFIGRFKDTMVKYSKLKQAIGFDDALSAAKWLEKRSPSEVFLKASRGMRLERIVDELA